MIKFRRIISSLLIISILISVSVFGKNTEIKHSSISAKVLEVLDTDALKVSLDITNEIAYIKLKGIKGNGYTAGYNYLTNLLMGEKITILKESKSYFDGKWNYVNVIFNGKNINNDLVSKGYAIVDKSQIRGSYYDQLIESQNIAYSYNMGLWESQSSYYSSISNSINPNYYTKNRVNINTASLSQLKTFLKNIPDNVAENIINYREKNPFNTIKEIKFVKGFTKELFQKNKNIMSVATNINTANEYELVTLDFSSKEIDFLMELRNKAKIKDTKEIVNKVISSNKYSKIQYFISTYDTDEIYHTVSSSVANINVSEKSYLQQAGLSYQEADEIINNRKNGYTYKTLEELLKFENTYISEEDINKFEDNLTIATNINTPNKEELISLLGSYDADKVFNKKLKDKEELTKYISSSKYEKIKNVVYIDNFRQDYININTASKDELLNLGFPESDVSKIIEKRPILNSNNLPMDISKLNEKISLYTNINTASINELSSLGLDNIIINNIISYRLEQPFGSKEEIKIFFAQNNSQDIYSQIEKYIVAR